MQIIDAPYFKCDFCGKRQFRKSDMTLHEKWCKHNPNNKHRCFDYCVNLIKSDGDYDGDEFTGTRTVFTCKITGQEMYSFIAERRKLPVVSFPDTVRMPLECDLYKDRSTKINFDDFEF